MPVKGPISGRTLYTAEEYLEMDEYRITGRLKRELESIEEKYEKQQAKLKGRKTKKKKKVTANDVVKALKKKYKTLNVKESEKYDYICKIGRKTKCYITDQERWVSIYSRSNNFKVHHIKTKTDLNKEIKNV